MTLFSFIVSSVALWTAYFTFPTHASILAIAFITIGTVPVIYKIFAEAEHIQERLENKLVIHRYLIAIYGFLSLGIILSFIAWYMILPDQSSNVCLTSDICINGISKDTFFSEQIKTLGGIENLRAKLTGNVTALVSCGSSSGCWFDVIFFNNLTIIVLAIVFSILYGSGAIFLISWNSSVVAIAIAERLNAMQHFAFLGFLPHGIPEFVGYFSAAIAGGLFSAMIVRHRLKKIVAVHMIMEIMVFVMLALISILVGAIIESYIIIGNQEIPTVLSALYIIGLILFGLGIRKKDSYHYEPRRRFSL
ncbi:MAG: hypothetical protein COT15_00125 [Candidatus Diapherotrites archaeon CG08_land_8_20_14_0_20_34_12]|nr:MAG: hypothetical protein COT15_00125 [Candidatus Diapherotrites archaeon CG08_land_8_20_14_0_20_34_12]